jgi:hypothetical protein
MQSNRIQKQEGVQERLINIEHNFDMKKLMSMIRQEMERMLRNVNDIHTPGQAHRDHFTV